MARVLLAWELGSGFGHVLPLRNLAGDLVRAGHTVLVAARELPKVHAVFRHEGAVEAHAAGLLAAPFFPGVTINAGQICALSDVVWFEAGGHAPEVLGALLGAWRELLVQLKIDLLVGDAAPLALAAAQGQCASLGYSNTFHCTDREGWKTFRDWERIDATACTQRAQRLLQHLNQARTKLGLAAVDTLEQGFGAQHDLLRCVPELDFAGIRAGVSYVGQVQIPGALAAWPAPELPKKLFAYLRADHPHIERAIGALARLTDTSVLCFLDAPAGLRWPQAPHLTYVQQPLDMAWVLPQADAVLCHGGSLQTLVTQYGKPSVALPLHAEQFLAARQAMRAGVALMPQPLERPDVLGALRQVLGQPQFAAAAATIGERWPASAVAPTVWSAVQQALT